MANRNHRHPPHRRDRSRSPYRRDRSRSRSPWRPGKETSREDSRHQDLGQYGKGGSDSRRSRLTNDQEALHRGHDTAKAGKPQTIRDRDRSRSPFRYGRSDQHPPPKAGRHRLGSQRSTVSAADSGLNMGELRGRDKSSLQRESAPEELSEESKAKSQNSYTEQAKINAGSHEKYEILQVSGHSYTDSCIYSHEDVKMPEEAPKLSEAEIIEQRRQRRKAIMAKHQSNPSLLVKALEQNVSSAASTPLPESSGQAWERHSPPSSAESPGTPRDVSPPGSPSMFAVNNDAELANPYQNGKANDVDGPSAADYDPNMNEDRPDRKLQDHPNFESTGHGDALQPDPDSSAKPTKEFDMFADDDDFDMFAPEDPTTKLGSRPSQAMALDQSLLDNWDHPDGHYRIILREVLNDRYIIKQELGKGTFATVVRAEDTETGAFVAIKIARNNDTMYKAGMKEVAFLQLLNEKDPEDKRHMIRLLRHFNHKGHLCLVFENLSNDLREVLKKFGRNVGLNITAIRMFAQQMFLALNHMKNCSVLHADLKPDNILVNEKRNMLKICDLGTAVFLRDVEVTPLLVSRYYRAPEIILGMDFDYGIDMWAIGCTLFELYTGKILFPGSDNNQMLRHMQDCRGKFPNRMVKKARLADEYFDSDFTFYSREPDHITGHMVSRPMNFKETKDIRTRLTSNIKDMSKLEQKELLSFVDLIEKCMQLDPEKRITAKDALKHPFIYRPSIPTAGPTMRKITAPAPGVRPFK